MELYLDFIDPLAVSEGFEQDRVIIEILRPEVFKALESDEVFRPTKGFKLRANLPKQMAKGVEEEDVKKSAESNSRKLLIAMIASIIF